MFHTNTRKVIEDWNARRGERQAPDRADISPADYRDLLPQLFILGGEGKADESFRLAGGLVTDLHGQDLRGVAFLGLFAPSDRPSVAEALAIARTSGKPMVLEASAWTAVGERAGLEIVLAPLVGPSGELDRVLGLYQPTSSLRRLMGASVEWMTLDAVRSPDGEALDAELRTAPAVRPRTHLRLVALDGVRLD